MSEEIATEDRIRMLSEQAQRACRHSAFLERENALLRQSLIEVLECDKTLALVRAITVLDNITRPIPGCEFYGASYWPYHELTEGLTAALEELREGSK